MQKALFFKSVFSFSYLWFNRQSNCNTFHNYINLFFAGELLRARYSPIFPQEVEDHTTGLKDPSTFWIAMWVFHVHFQLTRKDDGFKANCLTSPPNEVTIWTQTKSNDTHLLYQGSCKQLQPFSGTFQGLLKDHIRFLKEHLLGIWFHSLYKNAHSHFILKRL